MEYGMAVDVLGRVVEAVSGQRLSAFLDERLFCPLRRNRAALPSRCPKIRSQVAPTTSCST